MQIFVFSHRDMSGGGCERFFFTRSKAMREAEKYIREMGLRPEWEEESHPKSEFLAGNVDQLYMDDLSNIFSLYSAYVEEGD